MPDQSLAGLTFDSDETSTLKAAYEDAYRKISARRPELGPRLGLATQILKLGSARAKLGLSMRGEIDIQLLSFLARKSL